MLPDIIQKCVATMREYCQAKARHWEHDPWKYIDRGHTPAYDGSFLARRSDEEMAAALPTLLHLVREGDLFAIKYMTEAAHMAAGFNMLPPVIFYCQRTQKDHLFKILDTHGFSDAEWREDQRGSFQLARWGIYES